MAYSNDIDEYGLSNEVDIYKETFKHFKNSDFRDISSSMIDFTDLASFSNKTIELSTKNSNLCLPHCETSHHFKAYDKWKIYSLKDSINGLIVVPQILRDEFRSNWFDYFHNSFPLDKQQNIKANIELSNVDSKPDFCNLRWITFGYHYNWDTKNYAIDQKHVVIPDRVVDLCKVVCTYLNYDGFKPEAGIINYYNRKSTLFFHTDHSELNHEAPLLSLSLGCPAIFLIGGLTKDSTTPIVPILLGDSDLLIMSKDSRLALHAIAKIIPHEDNKPTTKSKTINKTQTCRINLNIRQVNIN